ncbi:MAG TPA: TonB-dependent receptor [Chitinophagaceae bacterium]|nr:TonB-dependent receptor [Chitinophagaceae bacterium]
MKKHLFVLAAVLISSQLTAQLVPLQREDTTGKTLDEVVLTANKFEQKQSTTGKVISVINKEQIEKSSGRSVAQVLNEQAGITIAGANNAPGSVQSVFMRGASSGRTLILLDGIPMNDPSMINNEFDLNLFSINEVERIEICRGAQSTLYGSDAIAGAINIITVKKDVKKVFNINVTAGFGNKNTIRNNVQLFGKINNKLTYTSRFAKLSSNGFSAAYDSTATKEFDKDGYDGNVFNTGLQYQVIPSLLLKTFIQHSQYKADIDAGVFADEKDYYIKNSNLASGAGANFKKGIVSISANYQYGELSRKYRNDSLFVRPSGTKFENNKYGGRTQYAELYGNITAADWLTILVGADYRWANMNQQYFSLSSFGPYSSNFKDTTLHQTSYYGSLLINALKKRLNVEVGGRMNKHSRYGTNSTYTFNPSFNINNSWRVFGSIASGFKAPSIFQVYDVFSGNKDLKPETSTNYELGVQQLHEKISSRLVYFHRDINNGIDYDYNNFRYFNFVKQTVNGLELELRANPVSKLTIFFNYTLLTGEEQTQSRKNFADTVYNYLLRRPKNNINLNAGYQFDKNFFMSLSAKSVSSRFDVGGYKKADVLLDKYFLLNAYAEYKVSKNMKFFADLQNITGNKYFDIRGYNTAPFLINGGISFQF